MKDDDVDLEIRNKIKQAEKEMKEKGRNYDGLGEEIEKLGHQGPHFGPRNDIEKQKLINDIRKSGKEDDE